MNPNQPVHLNQTVHLTPNSTTTQTITTISKIPTLIAWIVGFYIVRWFLAIISVLSVVILRPGGASVGFSDVLAQVGPVFLGTDASAPTIFIWIMAIALVAGIIGIWFMQRWAVVIYAAVTLALGIYIYRQMGSLSTIFFYNLINICFLNIVLIVLSIIHFKKMK